MPVYILCCKCCMCEQVIHESNKSMIYIHTKHPGCLFINAGSRRDYQSTEDAETGVCRQSDVYALFCNQSSICLIETSLSD